MYTRKGYFLCIGRTTTDYEKRKRYSLERLLQENIMIAFTMMIAGINDTHLIICITNENIGIIIPLFSVR